METENSDTWRIKKKKKWRRFPDMFGKIRTYGSPKLELKKIEMTNLMLDATGRFYERNL